MISGPLMQGEDAVVVILSGTLRLAEIVQTDPQVQRRFSMLRLPLLSSEQDGPRFAGISDRYWAEAGLTPPDALDLVARLFHDAQYGFGVAMEHLLGDIKQALLAGHDSLDSLHIAQGWTLLTGCCPFGHPFQSPDWYAIEPDPAQTPAIGQTHVRKRRTSGR